MTLFLKVYQLRYQLLIGQSTADVNVFVFKYLLFSLFQENFPLKISYQFPIHVQFLPLIPHFLSYISLNSVIRFR